MSPSSDLSTVSMDRGGMTVSMRGIAKLFPGVVANKDVDLEIRAGEIHALLGENGAGKSTLMNVLAGVYQPDAGSIAIDGQTVRFTTPRDAIAAGIGMVHQHFKLAKALTVSENIHIGWSETPLLARSSELETRTAALARKFNLSVEPGKRVRDLSAGEQQRVEILRVLSRRARVLIMDEPTAVLTPQEADDLIATLRAFRDTGYSVVLITHKLREVLSVADRVTVLRGGQRVGQFAIADCNAPMLANLMVGREFAPRAYRSDRAGDDQAAPNVLELTDVNYTGDSGVPLLKNVTLDVRAGEILGIAGVAGNGQRELSQVAAGMIKPTSGSLRLDGERIEHLSAGGFAEKGIGHIPEDRLRSGLSPTLSVTENLTLREYKKPPVARGRLFSNRNARRLAQQIVEEADVSVPELGIAIRDLSGGNQQRLIVRRETRIANRLLIATYPSRGLDIGAIDRVRSSFLQLREQGAAVLLISEDLDELFDVCDRIAVLFDGRITGVFDADPRNLDAIGLAMGGDQEESN